VRGEEEIRRSSSPRLNLEMVLLRLSQLPRLEDMNRMVDELERLERVLSGMPDQPRPGGGDALRSVEAPGTRIERRESGPAEGPPFSGEAGAGSNRLHGAGFGGESFELRPPASPEDMVAKWPAFVQWLEGKDPKLAAKLGQSSLKSVSESAAELEILEIYENLFQDGENTAALAAHAAGYFGVHLKWRVSTKASLREEKPERAVKKGSSAANPRRVVMESRAVQQAIEVLGGELIEVRPLDRGAPSGRKGRGPKPSE
jgi:DNA polymerase-3 subunit gamma/tau